MTHFLETDYGNGAPNRILKPIVLLSRYGCAVIVSFFVSVLFAASGSVLFGIGFAPFLVDSDPKHQTACFGIAYVTALAGVVPGSACLTGYDRRLACAAFTMLGLGYYDAGWDVTKEQAHIGAGHPLALPLVLGGITALLISILFS